MQINRPMVPMFIISTLFFTPFDFFFVMHYNESDSDLPNDTGLTSSLLIPYFPIPDQECIQSECSPTLESDLDNPDPKGTAMGDCLTSRNW